MGQNESSAERDRVNNDSKSAAKTNEDNTFNMSREFYEHKLLKRCEHIHFDVEAWYKILQDQTFYTEFIPISPSIAQAFVNYYQTRYNSKNLLNSSDIQLIQSVQRQLNQQIFNSKSNQFQINGTFIRLSSRSPKDGTSLDSQKLIQ
ncbi:unnamed protein product, partial [Rotaria sordida]